MAMLWCARPTLAPQVFVETRKRGRQSEKEETLTGPICRLLVFFVVLVMILRS